MNPDSLEDHVLFTMQWLQMMEDFQILEDECPACGRATRSNTICLREECDFMLFVQPGRLHPSVISWVMKMQRMLGRDAD